ncbi:MAG: hypothetical protein OEZ25_06685, partial [Candidatus Bathyarchaeota archaeon]|nr:hypothetical protein [Candidatus Bathyarchaeota archaeon]
LLLQKMSAEKRRKEKMKNVMRLFITALSIIVCLSLLSELALADHPSATITYVGELKVGGEDCYVWTVQDNDKINQLEIFRWQFGKWADSSMWYKDPATGSWGTQKYHKVTWYCAEGCPTSVDIAIKKNDTKTFDYKLIIRDCLEVEGKTCNIDSEKKLPKGTTTWESLAVGGIVVPIDKFGLLAPYIGLASTILVVAVATAIHVKRTRHIKKLTRVALLMLLAGTLSIVLSVTSVKASVSLTIDPQKASVGTSAVIWIWTGDGSIRIPKGDFTVIDPNGKVSTFNKDLEFSDTAVGITYPDDPNWSPAGCVNTVGTYTVKVKTYSLEKTFERTKNEKSVGGIWFPVNKLTLLAPYIGLASTMLVATVATAIYVKRVKHRKEKQ